MMELADMRDLGSRAERRAGSTPVTRTTASEEANCTPLPPGRRKLRIRWLLLPFQTGGLTGVLRFGLRGSHSGPPIWFKTGVSRGTPVSVMGNGSELNCPGAPEKGKSEQDFPLSGAAPSARSDPLLRPARPHPSAPAIHANAFRSRLNAV